MFKKTTIAILVLSALTQHNAFSMSTFAAGTLEAALLAAHAYGFYHTCDAQHREEALAIAKEAKLKYLGTCSVAHETFRQQVDPEEDICTSRRVALIEAVFTAAGRSNALENERKRLHELPFFSRALASVKIWRDGKALEATAAQLQRIAHEADIAVAKLNQVKKDAEAAEQKIKDAAEHEFVERLVALHQQYKISGFDVAMTFCQSDDHLEDRDRILQLFKERLKSGAK